MCPALMFAIRRTVNVKGRIKTLTVSIRIKSGIKTIGAPPGAKWAAEAAGFNIHPETSKAPQSTIARDPGAQRLLVIP